MELILLTICCAASVANLVLGLAANRKRPEPVEHREKEAKDLMDEGFENLMRYEVNGQTGFEMGG